MNRKNILKIVLILLVVALIFMVFREHEAKFYLGNTATTEYDRVDVQFRINDNLVFDDTIYYHPYGYIIIKEPLRGGFHEVRISSKKAAISLTRRIFVVRGKHVVVEFMRPIEGIREQPEFYLRSKFGSFYYE